MKPRAFICCVGFSDFLALTLPYNRHHFKEVIVATSIDDIPSRKVARANNAGICVTDAFYKNGAKFNKWLALEHALEAFGRHGFIAFIDVDIFWPKELRVKWEQGFIYSFKRRRLLLDVTAPIPPESKWSSLPLDPQHGEMLGFTQIFHGNDPVLGKLPWFPQDLPHAALGDCHFQYRWDLSKKVWLDYDCLHLGDYANNWLGRVVQYRDGTFPPESKKLEQEVKELKHSIWGGGHFLQNDAKGHTSDST